MICLSKVVPCRVWSILVHIIPWRLAKLPNLDNARPSLKLIFMTQPGFIYLEISVTYVV